MEIGKDLIYSLLTLMGYIFSYPMPPTVAKTPNSPTAPKPSLPSQVITIHSSKFTFQVFALFSMGTFLVNISSGVWEASRGGR